jgi:hypothetical protein
MNMNAQRSSAIRDPISTAELERRWRATRAAMGERNLDALVLQSSEDWMGGYTRWFTDTPAINAYPRSVIFPRDGLMTTCEVGILAAPGISTEATASIAASENACRRRASTAPSTIPLAMTPNSWRRNSSGMVIAT